MVTDNPQEAPGAPESWEIEQLLATLEQIPRGELADGPDRDALASHIRAGDVDNLYRPLGAEWHNIAWSHVAPYQDPRQRVSDWIASRHAAQQALEQLAEHMRMTSQQGGEA